MLACQRDPSLRDLETEVLSCEPVAEGFEVVLADTVLYPEGGGQPADHGTIGRARITDVQRFGDRVVHTADRAVAPGPTRVVVDWRRRYDHMQQHTAQHLLTAMAHNRFGWSTTSFHLSGDRCDIELDTPAVGASEISALEEAVNAEVRAARPVEIRVVDPEGFAALDVRSRGVPDGIEQIRLIEIAGIDVNTCGGTHVSNTAELGQIHFLGTEKVRGGTRLYFIAGDRVRGWLRRALDQQSAISGLLSRAPESHVETLHKLIADGKAATKTLRGVAAELAELLGAELARTSAAVGTLHRDEADSALLNQIASAALRHRPDLCLLLTGGAPEGDFLIVDDPGVLTRGKADILEILGGRGGGPPGRLQGKGSRIDRRDQLLSGPLKR